jgi:hypothetical protein
MLITERSEGDLATLRALARRMRRAEQRDGLLVVAHAISGFDTQVSSVYRTLERLGYSCLAPRPRHEKQDLQAQQIFKEQSAPLLSEPSERRSLRTEDACASSSWTKPDSGSKER